MTYSCLTVSEWTQHAEGYNYLSVFDAYRATWKDATNQWGPYIRTYYGCGVAEGRDLADAQMAALRADARFVVLWEAEDGGATPGDLSGAQLTALQTSLATALSPDVAKLVTLDTAAPDVIAARVVEAVRYEPWRASIDVQAGAVYYHDGNLYECVQAHRTQSDWTPTVAKALWKRYYEPDDDPWPWVQPTGAHDVYRLGARVTYGGYTWVSNHDANSWSPGTGELWTNLTPPPATPDWATGVAYKVGDVVAYLGNNYRCLQAHTSIPTWNPVATLNVLWVRL